MTQRKASFTDEEWEAVVKLASLPASATDSNIIRAALKLPTITRGGKREGAGKKKSNSKK